MRHLEIPKEEGRREQQVLEERSRKRSTREKRKKSDRKMKKKCVVQVHFWKESNISLLPTEGKGWWSLFITVRGLKTLNEDDLKNDAQLKMGPRRQFIEIRDALFHHLPLFFQIHFIISSFLRIYPMFLPRCYFVLPFGIRILFLPFVCFWATFLFVALIFFRVCNDSN